MFGASKQQCTVVAEGMKIEGNVTAEGTVQINGQLEGEIHCTSLIVARGARVAGIILAKSVVVDGLVEGPIQAEDVVLKAQAHVVGDITCQSVTIERGAFVEGRLLRSLNGGGVDETKLKALETAREEEARHLAGAEVSTRKAELVVEARHLSGNPDLLIDDALAFMAKRGNPQAKAFVTAHPEEHYHRLLKLVATAAAGLDRKMPAPVTARVAGQ
jgi:cytoskeletal protein CcmA (bactofilin family)